MSTGSPTASPQEPAAPTMRADALRNREAILAAAREVFLQEGIDGSVEDIARRAGVGVGTVYRRFPTKEDLVDAIIAEHFDALGALMRSHLAAEDPWAGFVSLLHQTLELFADNRGFKAVVGARFADGGQPPDNVRELIEASSEVIRRAQDAGALRSDFTVTDLPLVFSSVGAVMDATRDINPRLWERHLSMLLDGLRPGAASPAPVAAMTADEQFLMNPEGRRGPGRC